MRIIKFKTRNIFKFFGLLPVFAFIVFIFNCNDNFNSYSNPKIVFNAQNWDLILFDIIEPEYYKYYSDIIITEMKKYPKNFFRKIDLKTITIVKNLKTTEGKNLGGGTLNPQFKTIYIDINFSDNSLKKTFHHELNRYIEYSILGYYCYDNEQWNDLFILSDNKILPDFPLRGFISYYSRTNQLEDRAEIFGFFMAGERYRRELIEQAKNDDVLYRKIELLFSFYKENLDLNLIDAFLSEVRE